MRILIIGAHYDDIELSAGGTVAKFIKEGHKVFVNVVTTSDYTSYDGTVLRNKYSSRREGVAGLLVLGVKESNIQNLGFETKCVPFSVDLIEKGFPLVELIGNQKNFGFARAVNQGIKKATGEYLLLLNTDVVCPSGSIFNLLKFARKTANLARTP